jgi:multisubunit Na+/H+ antiporter MnhE subunit
MRFWRFWLNSLILSSEHNPASFIEGVMLLLATIVFAIWGITDELPYMILCLSYAIGAAISILVREAIAPSPQTRLTRITALLLLLISLYIFADFL